ncbi:MAG TPA: transcription antitermination factor NusB [Thermoleophilaceae bacterium]|nr:transcription antitermination factor NusB [Thermoleophilaceae bacterium]
MSKRTDQRRAAVVALYQADVTGRPAPDLVERGATPFTRELVEGVEKERGALDESIARHATGWSLDRIAPLERNILRVAVHEMRSRPDVPTEVAIDEAVEAAKELCSADAPGFVNGILGAVQRQEAHQQ